MSKLAVVFSGQGSQYSGMGRELYENIPGVREIYLCASDIVGFDVAKASFEGDEQLLRKTEIAQPVTYTLSLAAFSAAEQLLGDTRLCCLGHSLGEYAALFCAGAFGLEDGFRIIAARARAMARAAAAANGAMYAVLGLDAQRVAAACEQAVGLVLPVNFNLPSQTVISGEESAAAQAAELLAAQGGKIRRLEVSSAFHTPLMRPAAEELKDAVSGIVYRQLKREFSSNLTGGVLEIDDYPEYFARHMVSPVLFTEQAAALERDGTERCVEFGPKRTAATLIKKNCRGIAVHQVEDLATLEGLSAFLQG